MTSIVRDRPARLPRAGWVALGLAAACGAADVGAGLGYRAGWLALGPALQTIRWSTGVALVALLVAVVVLLASITRRSSRGAMIAAAAALLALCVAGPPLYLWRQAQVLPRIHDVSTDTVDPPGFEAVVPLRQEARNPVRYDPSTAAAQKAGYPDIAPVMLDLPAPRAMTLAEQAARDMGWQIVADEAARLRIEATATTRLFGFKDDVVVRIVPSGPGSRIDIRSLSQVGGSDFGANAQRIRAFVARLRELARST